MTLPANQVSTSAPTAANDAIDGGGADSQANSRGWFGGPLTIVDGPRKFPMLPDVRVLCAELSGPRTLGELGLEYASDGVTLVNEPVRPLPLSAMVLETP